MNTYGIPAKVMCLLFPNIFVNTKQYVPTRFFVLIITGIIKGNKNAEIVHNYLLPLDNMNWHLRP